MPVVTLITDFGTQDGYVGAMKGVLLAAAPQATVVDVTHEIARGDVAAGAFALAQAAPCFPPGTIHVVVVDPGVGGARREVVVDVEGGRSCYVGPDNGVFELALAGAERVAAYEIRAVGFRREAPAATFHGRDVFAPTAARLALGAKPSEAGPAVTLEGRTGGAPLRERTVRGRRELVGQVVHVDRFGNAITDLPAARLGQGGAVRGVRAGRFAVAKLVTTYEDVGRGKPLAYVGSAGTLELGVREGAAARRYGLRRGARVTVNLS